MRAGEYIAMALFAGVGGLIVYGSRKLKFKAAEMSTFKLWLVQIALLLSAGYGSSLLDGSYSVFGYILLIISIPILIFTTSIGFYRILTGDWTSEK